MCLAMYKLKEAADSEVYMQNWLDPDFLCQIPLFHGLTKEQITGLQVLIDSYEVASRRVLITTAEKCRYVYILVKGSVKVQIERDNGQAVIIALLGSGQTLGEMGAADGMGSSATIITLEQCVFLQITVGDFEKLRHLHPQIAENLLHILSARLRLANRLIVALATMDAEGRLACQILSLAKEFGNRNSSGHIAIPLRLSQTTLGEMSGLSRNRVNYVLQQFERQRFIARPNTSRLIVCDLQALEERCLTVSISHDIA